MLRDSWDTTTRLAFETERPETGTEKNWWLRGSTDQLPPE